MTETEFILAVMIDWNLKLIRINPLKCWNWWIKWLMMIGVKNIFQVVDFLSWVSNLWTQQRSHFTAEKCEFNKNKYNVLNICFTNELQGLTAETKEHLFGLMMPKWQSKYFYNFYISACVFMLKMKLYRCNNITYIFPNIMLIMSSVNFPQSTNFLQ